MDVTRDGDTFTVRELGDAADFWGVHFAGSWEAATKAVVDRFVDGGLFVDIGAWVGPVSLWASRRGARVVAAEPDPLSYPHLHHNLSANGVRFNAGRIAISDHDGIARLGRRTGWGDSMSSLTSAIDAIDVVCLTVESFLAPFDLSDLQLIKIDIEGGEGVVIPHAEPFLRRLGVPVCLSLHPQWWPADPRPSLRAWREEALAPDLSVFHPPRPTLDARVR